MKKQAFKATFENAAVAKQKREKKELTEEQKEALEIVRDEIFTSSEDVKTQDETPHNSENEFESIDDIKFVFDAEKKENKVLELENKFQSIMQQFEELKKQNQELHQNNEQLKQNKVKLTFEQAENLYKQKMQLLRDLRLFETHKKDVFEASVVVENENLFASEKFAFSFEASNGNYNKEVKFKISNTLILKEFFKFITVKIDEKIKGLKKEVETIDFI